MQTQNQNTNQASVADIYAGNYLNMQLMSQRNLFNKDLAITAAWPEEFSGKSNNPNDKKPKLVLSLGGVDKYLVLSKDNAARLAAAWGDDYTKWVGKVFFATPDKTGFGTDTIKVYPRGDVQQPAAPAAPAAAA